ncbi:hypothetical protein FA15DRAFT_755283 [Coprinopsis marcescibilis]|uniref:Uncharacterized protein n=1 Tax=Coprinopsis marcescibilis TaxID=230819 RepID=A0A5C3L1M5_COPMA|nr:hypothetical protein FA15DRAFT_755283 [Coprinopsis marcescibilis]
MWMNQDGGTAFSLAMPNRANVNRGTYTATTNHSGNVRRSILVDFYGSAIQVYFTLSNSMATEASLSLDVNEPSQIRHIPNSLDNEYAYKVPVIAFSSLLQTWHRLEIVAYPFETGDPNYVNFDGAEFTWDPEIGSPELLTAPTRSTSLPIGAVIGISVGGTLAAVVLAIAAAILIVKRRQRHWISSAGGQDQPYDSCLETNLQAQSYPASDFSSPSYTTSELVPEKA